MDVAIGELLDKKYRIVRLLGEGGMGAVYEGENVRVHNRVAIKVLHSAIATTTAAVERFEREAQAAGKIGSEHICEVYDLGDLPNGARYMVMEFLDGEPLSERVRQVARMTPEQVAPIMLQLLDGLGAAHTAGIVHRDVKPENVFLVKSKTGGDFVKVVDFGVSKFNVLSGDSAMNMTRTGAVIGTPYYMSPEQARGTKTIDHRSDLYSVGVVLYECATGRVPFDAETFNELMFKIALEPPPAPESIVQGLDPRFGAIIKKAMAREVGDRYQTAAEFAGAIQEWIVVSGAMFAASRASNAGFDIRASAASFPSTSSLLINTGNGERPADPLGITTGDGFSSTASKGIQPRRKAPVLALSAVAVGLVCVLGFAATRLGTAKVAAAGTSVEGASASPVAMEPPPVAQPTPVAEPAAALSAGVHVDELDAPTPSMSSATPEQPQAAHAHHGSSRHTAATTTATPKASAQPSAEPTTQVKGRTIHTEL